MSQVSELPLTEHVRAPAGAPEAGHAGARVPHWLHRLRWPLGALLLIAVAAAIVAWADVRPGYDPYGWIGWGHLTLHGRLDTDGAPSWKPLPYIFTLPYALFGRTSVYLWMTTAYAISLSGLIFAWRVAYRLVDPYPERRWAGHVGGLAAALAVLGIFDFAHSILTAESDTMIVALCLAGADAMLHRRYRWAFWALWLGALGRPEAWSLLFVYGAWAFVRQPRMRWHVVLGLLLIPALWFGIPALTSKSPFSAANLAENSPRAVHGDKFTGVISRFLGLQPLTVKLCALAVTILDRSAPRVADRRPGRRRAPVGRGRDRLCPARLVGGAALHLRGRSGDRGARRGARRPRAHRPRRLGGRRAPAHVLGARARGRAGHRRRRHGHAGPGGPFPGELRAR